MIKATPGSLSPTAQIRLVPGRADTDHRVAEPAGGVATADQAVPFQRRDIVWATPASVLKVRPAAQTSPVPRAVTLRRSPPLANDGLGTIDQAVPSQCSVTGCVA